MKKPIEVLLRKDRLQNAVERYALATGVSFSYIGTDRQKKQDIARELQEARAFCYRAIEEEVK